MNTKTLTTEALSIINQYEHFRIGSGECVIPYFNNKIKRNRMGLRAFNGKGSPKEIYEEVSIMLVRDHVDKETISGDILKKTLVDHNIGIECSGFAYHILNAESRARGIGTLDKHIHFVNCKGIIGKIRCSLRPIENCDVLTFSAEKNSTEISIDKIQPGDIITMLGTGTAVDRNHVLIIDQVEYQNFSPTKIHYVHSIAYPTDGVYSTGIRRGTIDVTDLATSIVNQSWRESALVAKLPSYVTTVRRLRAFVI
jgi:hypothetical protein